MVAHAQDLRHARHRADLVEVLFLRQLHTQLSLRNEEDLFPVLHGALERAHGDLAFKVKAGVHAREDVQPPQRDDRKIFCYRFHGFSL